MDLLVSRFGADGLWQVSSRLSMRSVRAARYSSRKPCLDTCCLRPGIGRCTTCVGYVSILDPNHRPQNSFLFTTVFIFVCLLMANVGW
jgi:hypothetical protein